MTMATRRTNNEDETCGERTEADGIAVQAAVLPAVRQFGARSEHGDRVAAAAELVRGRQADAIDRLAE